MKLGLIALHTIVSSCQISGPDPRDSRRTPAAIRPYSREGPFRTALTGQPVVAAGVREVESEITDLRESGRRARSSEDRDG
jgi:hypothetical protein